VLVFQRLSLQGAAGFFTVGISNKTPSVKSIYKEISNGSIIKNMHSNQTKATLPFLTPNPLSADYLSAAKDFHKKISNTAPIISQKKTLIAAANSTPRAAGKASTGGKLSS
jgi:hypothetical protein